MISIQAHFDGKVIVPHDPVDLPRDQALIVRIEPVPESVPAGEESCLDWLAEHSVDSTAVPTDLSFQHDHYLYGSPRGMPESGGGRCGLSGVIVRAARDAAG
jgi:hypothetical protein